jgi:mannose-6-phosphate isomerase
MGTYPELPSYVLETGEDLQDVIDKHPDELIGKNVAQKFNHTKLPYLPKVLSIAKALPLQLHPVCPNQPQSPPHANDIAEQGISV